MNHDFRHVFHIHKLRKELKEVYASQMIERFASGLVVVFIPVYLLIIGHGVMDALITLMFAELITILTSVPAARIASRLGLKHTILYRIPGPMFLVLWLYAMPYMEISFVNLAIVGIAWGLSRTFYWISINSEFVENCDKLHRGEEVGFFLALPIIISIGSPYIGGVVLEFAGFPVLFSLFIALMFISVIPLFLTEDYRKFFGFEFRDVSFRLVNRLNVGLFFQGFLLIAEFLLWPLYSYIALGDTISTGLVASLSAMGIAFFTLFAGREADRISRRKMLVVGSSGYFVVWILRYLVATPLEFFVVSFLGGFFFVLLSIPIFASFSEKARENNILNYVSQREIFLSLGRLAVLSVIVFGLLDFHTALLLIGITSLLVMVIKLR